MLPILNGLQSKTDGIGATSTDSIVISNGTLATVGAQEQRSGRIRFTAQGWKTASTASSQTVDTIIQLIPITGVGNPLSYLDISVQVNAGGFTNVLKIGSNGTVGINVPSDINSGLPVVPLDVYSSAAIPSRSHYNATGGTSLHGIYDSKDAGNSGYLYLGMDIGGSTTSYGSSGSIISAGSTGTGTARDLILHTLGAKKIVFATNNTVCGAWDSAGLLGVGHTAPNYPLDVKGTADFGLTYFRTVANNNALFYMADSPTTTNNNYMFFGVDKTGVSGFTNAGAGSAILSTGAGGTGTARDLVLHTYGANAIKFCNSNALKGQLSSTGSWVLGNGALATTVTDGFTYLPSCAGTPTGSPTAITGMIPQIVDTTNGKIYWRLGGTWKSVTPA